MQSTAGKQCFIFLSNIETFILILDKDNTQEQGATKTTRIVSPYDNYKCLPLDISVTPRQGQEMILAPQGAEFLSTYWQDFSSISEYKVTLDSKQTKPLLYTKHGNNEVASYITTKSSGSLILLPYIDLENEEFTEEVELDDGWSSCWSEKGYQFGAKLVSSLINVDMQLRKSTENTVEPEWARSDIYAFTKEKFLERKF